MPPSPLPFIYVGEMIGALHATAAVLAAVLLIGGLFARNRRQALTGAAIAALIAIVTPNATTAKQMALWLYLESLVQEL